MRRIRTEWLNKYVYIIPCILELIYISYIKFGVYGEAQWVWIGGSKGFGDMCKAIAEFSSIVLGIYGFMIPAVIGRQDKFNNEFWKNIDKESFSRDFKHLIISGIITILASSMLLVHDIISAKVLMVLLGGFFWILAFYCCSSYRFIRIFISLIVEGRNNSDDSEKNEVREEHMKIKEELDQKIGTF